MGIVCAVCFKIAENEHCQTCVLSEDIAAFLLCTALYLNPKRIHALYVQYKRVSNIVFNAIINFQQVYFNLETCVKCGFALQRMRVERRLFYPKLSQRSCNLQHFTCTQRVAMHSIFNKKEFQAFFSTNYFTWEKCVQCAFAFQRMRVERRVFYPKISQRSCYVQHFTYNQ